MFSIAHHLSMTMISTDCNRWCAMFCLMNFQPSQKQGTIQHLSSGKAPGTDAIPAEVYIAGGLPMTEKLTELLQCMWRKEAILQDFKDASIIHLYKRKGNPQVCDNHRGFSLLSIAGKILAKVLLNRLMRPECAS